jgi:hypothetical protein
MAIVPMTNAVAGTVALSAEYNKLIANITDLDTRTIAVEAAVGGGTGEVPRKGGEWSFGASTQSVGAANTLLTAWTAVGTPNGVSHSAGVFTVTEAGLYAISASYRASGSTERWIWVCGTALTGDTWFKNSASANAFNVGVAGIRRLTAGQTIRIAAYQGTTQTIGRETSGDFCPGVTIYKIGN